MKENAITIKHCVSINKPKELVWDYTQNYDNRQVWDQSVLETTVLQTTPNRIVKLKLKGATMTLIYKLDERPNKTTLVAKEITSPIIINAGGSWAYEEQNGKTLWTQTNTIVFKKNIFLNLFLPMYRWFFARLIKKAMTRAKEEIEKS